MTDYNRNFDLSLEDMDLIETALRSKMAVKQDVLPDPDYKDLSQKVNDLLGRLHNQKNFYRPKTGPYIGG